MLHTMIEHPRPTRAEVSDVASAIYMRTDAIMLSGETAYGKYPVESIQTMDNIAREVEPDRGKDERYGRPDNRASRVRCRFDQTLSDPKIEEHPYDEVQARPRHVQGYGVDPTPGVHDRSDDNTPACAGPADQERTVASAEFPADQVRRQECSRPGSEEEP